MIHGRLLYLWQAASMMNLNPRVPHMYFVFIMHSMVNHTTLLFHPQNAMEEAGLQGYIFFRVFAIMPRQHIVDLSQNRPKFWEVYLKKYEKKGKFFNKLTSNFIKYLIMPHFLERLSGRIYTPDSNTLYCIATTFIVVFCYLYDIYIDLFNICDFLQSWPSHICFDYS